MEKPVNYFLKRLQENIIEQQKIIKDIKKEMKENERKTVELEKIIRNMTENEGLSVEMVAKYLNLEIAEINGIQKKQSHHMPKNYLNEEEMERFENVLKEIKESPIQKLFHFEPKIFQLIDDVSARYQQDIDNYVETEDEIKILDEFSFEKFSMGSSRKQIKKWLLKRLMNELHQSKMKGIMKQTKMED